MITKTCYARIGLLGNPSDGFYGATIASCITNYYATMRLHKSNQIRIVQHNYFDPYMFNNLYHLEATSRMYGYYGCMRLIRAACKRFSIYCREKEISLEKKNFTINYTTTIPRQVGLGGSSAIVTATWQALMEFYNVSDDMIPLPEQANQIHRTETEELYIRAGLQDRVVQTYGGTVYMDFEKSYMKAIGYGKYKRIHHLLLPNFFLAFHVNSAKPSGEMHNPIHNSFEQGDKEVIRAMNLFRSFAKEGYEMLQQGNHHRFGVLMNANFAIRRELYGDSAIGESNLRMIEIAKNLAAPVKFPGSGGSVIGMYDDEAHYKRLEKAYMQEGFNIVKTQIQNNDAKEILEKGC